MLVLSNLELNSRLVLLDLSQYRVVRIGVCSLIISRYNYRDSESSI